MCRSLLSATRLSPEETLNSWYNPNANENAGIDAEVSAEMANVDAEYAALCSELVSV